MKRFFQPIQKDGSSKKPALSTTLNNNEDDDKQESNVNNKEPLKFITWNANSLLLRAKNNWPEFSKLVSSFDPDIIANQEVRIPAAGSKGAPKNQGELKDDTNASRGEKKILMRALSSPPFGNYRVWWSLSDSKYAGTALLVKKCFKPPEISFSLDPAVKKHEPDGRLILAEFESLCFMNTYVPNNGWKEEESSFVRRRKWDKKMLELVLQLSDKPLIWSGDLNVRAKLVDAYRYLHKEKNMDCGSWSGDPVGKYRGKRMRIDYFLVSEKLKDRIVSCKMHGQGIQLEGFCGSDHCPVSLELAPSTPDLTPNEASN